jgi:hypothetical protein
MTVMTRMQCPPPFRIRSANHSLCDSAAFRTFCERAIFAGRASRRRPLGREDRAALMRSAAESGYGAGVSIRLRYDGPPVLAIRLRQELEGSGMIVRFNRLPYFRGRAMKWSTSS